MIADFYILTYDKLSGQLTTINEAATGRQLTFYPETKTFDEDDPLTIQLRQREAEQGNLNLSDRPSNYPTLAEYKLIKQTEIVEAAKVEQNQLVANYAPAEQASWDKKLEQAEAILASNNIDDAPVLQVEAVTFSGATTPEDILSATLFLAQTIKDKSDELYTASAQISGKRTLLWNQVEAATTETEVAAISWES